MHFLRFAIVMEHLLTSPTLMHKPTSLSFNSPHGNGTQMDISTGITHTSTNIHIIKTPYKTDNK